VRDCQDLGNGRLRPVRLLNAAVTNDPNLKGMRPLSNRQRASVSEGENFRQDLRDRQVLIANADAEERFRWELGASPDDRHCPSCEGLAGQVHLKAEWDAAGLSPGGGNLYCQGNCHCRLVRTSEAVSGTLGDAPLRRPMENSGPPARTQNNEGTEDVLANVGWSDEARAASLAVRRAKAAARKVAAAKAAENGDSAGRGHGRQNSSWGYGKEDPPADDYAAWFEKEGLAGMSAEAVETLTGQIREKLRNGVPLGQAEEEFLLERSVKGYAGESDSDPVFKWIEQRLMEMSSAEGSAMERRKVVGDSVEAGHERVEEPEARDDEVDELPEEDRELLRRHGAIAGNSAGNWRAVLRNDGCTAAAASREVRRAKREARKAGDVIVAAGGAAHAEAPAGRGYVGGSLRALSVRAIVAQERALREVRENR